MFKTRRNTEMRQTSYLCEGVWAADHLLRRQTEHRMFTLLWKAWIVYCIVGGGIGCLLSALDTAYYAVIVQLVIGAACLFLASLFYSRLWENFGYILLFFIMVFAAYALRSYINSGFYGVLNDIFETVSDYFESNAMRSYGERISNRMLAITVSMSYIGVVCCLVINISISRRMQYVFSILAVSVCLALPLYLELEPSLFSVVQLLTGLFLAACVHHGRHYTLHQDNTKYERKKKRYSYVYSVRTIVQFGGCLLFLIAGVSVAVAVIVPKESYHERHPAGALKQQTGDTVENLSVVGIAGLFNFYENVGGLTSGRLGGISSLRLDYETDLTLTFVPAAEERFYLRQFVSGEYVPFGNHWEREQELTSETEQAFKQAYEGGMPNMGKGQAVIENVAGLSSVYLPYYSMDVEKSVWEGRSQSYVYYTDFNIYNEKLREKLRLPNNLRNYLEVPTENQEAVERIIQEAGLDPVSLDEVNVGKLADYFQREIPYSYQPGVTPYGKDFVNYFLLENRRGYCAHFASAATLIFRKLGIPARYVEGYAIDPEDITEEGKVLEEPIERYYEGASDLEQTAVVKVNVIDANAHAWVEIWVPGKGWQVADVTPASEEEDPGQGLWGMFRRFFGNGMGGAATQETDTPSPTTSIAKAAENMIQTLLKVFGGVLLLVALVLLLRILLRRVCRTLRNREKGRNDLLIDFYQRVVQKMGKEVKGFASLVNYEQQINAMEEQGMLDLTGKDRQKLIQIMEQAGFSPTEISEQEDRWVRRTLRGGAKHR